MQLDEFTIKLFVPDDVDEPRRDELISMIDYQSLARVILYELSDPQGSGKIEGVPIAVRLELGPDYLLGETPSVDAA